jgi:hypothetical protein
VVWGEHSRRPISLPPLGLEDATAQEQDTVGAAAQAWLQSQATGRTESGAMPQAMLEARPGSHTADHGHGHEPIPGLGFSNNN